MLRQAALLMMVVLVRQDTLVRGLSMAQKLTVVEQLDSGVRSFDIRVVKGVMNGVNSWHGVHCTLTYQTVDVYLKQMADWLRLHTKEVLVVSISQHGDGSAVMRLDPTLQSQSSTHEFDQFVLSMILRVQQCMFMYDGCC